MGHGGMAHAILLVSHNQNKKKPISIHFGKRDSCGSLSQLNLLDLDGWIFAYEACDATMCATGSWGANWANVLRSRRRYLRIELNGSRSYGSKLYVVGPAVWLTLLPDPLQRVRRGQ
jgi:hypothetical protein